MGARKLDLSDLTDRARVWAINAARNRLVEAAHVELRARYQVVTRLAEFLRHVSPSVLAMLAIERLDCREGGDDWTAYRVRHVDHAHEAPPLLLLHSEIPIVVSTLFFQLSPADRALLLARLGGSK